MPKFFALPKQIRGNKIQVDGNDAHHIINVLRGKPGDEIIICDGEGTDHLCRIDSKDPLSLSILSSKPCFAEPETRITLFQGIPKGHKMDFIIEKTVELGIYEIVPVSTGYTIVKLEPGDGKKISRWQKIAETAAKQCGRGRIPLVSPPLSFVQALEKASALDACLAAYENENKLMWKEAVSFKKGSLSGKNPSLGIFIGPEGGYTPNEVELFKSYGIMTASLGSRILRTETAGFAALLLTLYERNEL